MLSARRLSLLVLLSLVAAFGFVVFPASADYVYCPPAGGPCVVIVTTPGGTGGGGGGGGSGGCNYQGGPVPCVDPTGAGNYGGDGCYYLRDPDQAPSKPGTKGAWYWVSCFGPGRILKGSDRLWLNGPPPIAASPAEAAARAVNLLGLTGPDIGIVPKSGSEGGLVGLPVWLWTRVAPTTWGPNSATASLPGVSVTAKATASKIVWNMGDGHSVTCTNPGMAYNEVYGKQPSPRCGYTYSTPGTYTVTGTTYWHVTWAGGGQTGALDVQRSSSTQIVIGELQVLVQ